MADHNIKICGEIYLDVHHQLASARRFNLNKASLIASHPQAIGQCSKWIEANLGNIERKIMNSSAEAARYAKKNKNTLCIVNDLAIEKYKLFRQEKNIEDALNNQTRFLIIGNESIGRTSKDKTSFSLRVKDASVLLIISYASFELETTLSILFSNSSRLISEKSKSFLNSSEASR